MATRVIAINYDALPDNMQACIKDGLKVNPEAKLVYIKLKTSGEPGWLYEYVTESDRDKGMCIYLERTGYICVLGISKNGKG